MTRLLAIMLLGFLAAPSFAHEISSQDRKNLDGLSQMARLHAQKACNRGSERNRVTRQAEQIRSLAETAASVPALRPGNISPGEFVAMIENNAGSGMRGDWRASFAHEESQVDCRVNVC